MVTLVIDGNCIAHRARHATGGLSDGDVATGVIFGFLSQLLHVAKIFKSNDIRIIWDSIASKRRKMFSGYKRLRYDKSKMSEEQINEIRIMREQVMLLRSEVLPTIGFQNNYIQYGYEGDDIIAKIVLRQRGEFVIVASDHDLYQLLQGNTRIWDPMKNRMITCKSFTENYRIPVNKWAVMKSIAGCKSDAVPGVSGVGEATAIKYIQGVLPSKYVTYRRIVQSSDIIERNAALVTLPLAGTKMPEVEENTFNREGLVEVAKEYGMHSFLRMDRMREWLEFFEYREEPFR